MNVLVDLGAYDGDTIAKFSDLANIYAKEWDKIFAFEPNKQFAKDLKKLTNVTYSDKAAWIYNGKITFSVDKSYPPLGSTVMKSKSQFKTGLKRQVGCFDFSEWTNNFVHAHLVVKMDIEGAEFVILEKMITDDTLKNINELYVEFHPNKVSEYTTDDKNDLLKRLQKQIFVGEWLE